MASPYIFLYYMPVYGFDQRWEEKSKINGFPLQFVLLYLYIDEGVRQMEEYTNGREVNPGNRN